jgi:hypothetical protein
VAPDSAEGDARRELRAVLGVDAEGAHALERCAPLVKADRGRELVGAILGDLRDAARKDPAFAEQLLAAGLAPDTLWRLGLGGGVLWFDARTFAKTEMGIERLARLEYLVCPDEVSGKRYECLAGLPAAEWEAFGAAYAEDRALLLRWRGADGRIVEVPLADALPWAKPRPLESHGLLIGGNHDERENRRLPPHETPIQIGIARPSSPK